MSPLAPPATLDLIAEWRRGNRRDVARAVAAMRKCEAMAFAVAFIDETGDEDNLSRLFGMMGETRRAGGGPRGRF